MSDAESDRPLTPVSDSAASSNDSALGYVAIDLLESGYDSDEQRKLIEPVEDELRSHLDAALHDGMRHAFRNGPEDGALHAIAQILDALTFEDVPDDAPRHFQSQVEQRILEKREKIENSYRDLIDETLRKAEHETQDQFIDWGPVV